jgi:hypothetical protein
VANRFLTAFQNLFSGVKLSEYHTGFRAFSRRLLETLALLENPDDSIFDNQMIAQAIMFGFRIGDVSYPTEYFEKASSINLTSSAKYGPVMLLETGSLVAHKLGATLAPRYGANGRKLKQNIILRSKTDPSNRD